jgi:acylglycerol lipase
VIWEFTFGSTPGTHDSTSSIRPRARFGAKIDRLCATCTSRPRPICLPVPPILPLIDYYSAHDGRRLAVRLWSANQAPQARVVFVHGITSHGGWYEQSAAFLAAAGFDVAFLDRRGSGLNGEQMGDVDCWPTWVDDIATFIRDSDTARAQSSQHKLPTILCSISWGGKLAAATARRHPGLLSGAAFLCPGIYSPYLPGLAKRLVLAAPAPAWLKRRRVPIPVRGPALFTEMPRWREFIERDPLALRTVTWRFAQADRRLTGYARDAAAFLHLPTLVMLAGQDRIVDNSRTRDFFARVPCHQKTLIEYYGAAHTLEFEPDPTRYFLDLAGWIERTVATDQS